MKKSLINRKMKKIRIFLIWLIPLLFILSCTPRKKEKHPEYLIMSLSAEPDTLNPILATDVYAEAIDNLVYETLVERDMKTLELKPLLATGWKISKNKLEYTFYLRKGVKWHDGKPFTADDVIFSFQKIKDPKVDAPHLQNYYKDVVKVEKIDDYTVKFTYSKPYFLALSICGSMPIVPKHIYENQDFNKSPFNRKPIGTGPYIFEKWKTGKEIVLTVNTNYWQKQPAIKKVIFKIITDDTVRLQLLKAGELDVAGLRPIQWIKQTSGKKFNEMFKKYKYYTPNYNYIGWNLRKPYFKDRRVREALTRLIDRKAILKNLLFGLGKITTGPFYIYSKYYDNTVKPYGYDPEKAKKLLEEAGWKDVDNDGILEKDGIEFRFTFLIPGGAKFSEQLATILKENFKKAGIVMNIRKLEWATFLQQIDERKFDAVTLGWAIGVEQDPYQLWHSSQAKKGSNFVGFSNAVVDYLIEKGRREFNEKKRIAMYKKIHRIIHYEQPYTFLYCRASLVAIHRRFKNVNIYQIRPGFDITEWLVPIQKKKQK